MVVVWGGEYTCTDDYDDDEEDKVNVSDDNRYNGVYHDDYDDDEEDNCASLHLDAYYIDIN